MPSSQPECRRYRMPALQENRQAMNKTLGWKLGLSVGIAAGVPVRYLRDSEELVGQRAAGGDARDRIHLGLDLKGGTHLILQVQVNDAVNGDSDRAVERLKEDLRTHKINYTDISKPDPVNQS